MDNNNEDSTTRRDLLLTGGLILGVASAGSVFAGEHDEHQHHHNGGSNEKLVNAAYECMRASQACLAHCLSEFKQGKTDMADCAQAVQESSVMCAAMGEMASLGTQHLKKIASACMDVCTSCEKQCDKFAKTHEVCKVCSDSCRALIKELKAVA